MGDSYLRKSRYTPTLAENLNIAGEGIQALLPDVFRLWQSTLREQKDHKGAERRGIGMRFSTCLLVSFWRKILQSLYDLFGT